MTWILQNEKPIQEHFTRPCWVQRKDGLIWYAAPGANQMGNCFTFNGLVTNDGCNEFVVVSTPLREIVAWQYAEMPAQPEPYVAQKPPKDLVGKWIDGAVRRPTGKEKAHGFLIREKGYHYYHKAVEWAPWAQEFVWLDPRTQRYIVYKPETVEWLEITEEQS